MFVAHGEGRRAGQARFALHCAVCDTWQCLLVVGWLTLRRMRSRFTALCCEPCAEGCCRSSRDASSPSPPKESTIMTRVPTQCARQRRDCDEHNLAVGRPDCVTCYVLSTDAV